MSKKPKAAPTQSELENVNFNWNVFAKMYAKDYSAEPFYFTQTSAGGKVRIACWSCDPRYTWAIAEQVLSEFPAKVNVLLKVQAEEENENDSWGRFQQTGVDKQQVLSTIRKYEDYTLGDASNEIAIRRGDTGEYIAYDCGGVLWLYPNDDGTRWCEYLTDRRIQMEYRALIADVFHWNRSAAEAKNQRDALILDLGLEPVEKAYS